MRIENLTAGQILRRGRKRYEVVGDGRMRRVKVLRRRWFEAVEAEATGIKVTRIPRDGSCRPLMWKKEPVITAAVSR